MSNERRKVEWSLDLEDMRVRAGQFVTEMMGGPVEAEETTLLEPLAGAESGRVMVVFSVGRATITALAKGSPNLFEAQLSYVGELDYQVAGGAERSIKLRQKTDFPNEVAAALSKASDLHWDLRLARDVPLQLELQCGVGDAQLDLSRLSVETIKLETGVGKASLTLPEQGKPVAAAIRAGVGLTEVRLPAGACGALKIKGGVGQARVLASPGSVIRLEAKTGLGALKLPAGMTQVESSGVKRVWQTANYNAAQRKTLIAFAGGVGRFELEFADSR